MRGHTGKTPFVCEVCGRYFAQAGGVRRHQLQTRICHPLNHVSSAKTLSKLADLHKTSQSEVAAETNGEKMPECYVKLRKITKVHECKYCQKTFLSLVKAKKHQQTEHKGATSSHIITKRILKQEKASPETEYTFKCPLCPRFFKYSFNRGRHLRKCVREKISKVQEKVGNKYQCPLCPVTFTMTSNRYRHIKNFCLRNTLSRLSKDEFKFSKPTEQEEVNVQIPKSGTNKGQSESKRYVARRKTLPLKELKHAPKFKCRFCPAVYRYGSGVSRHMKKHRLAMLTGDKVRDGEPGTLVTVVNQSEVSESGALPRCRICQKHFSTWDSVRTHELIHKGVQPHECEKCQRRFKNRSYLIEHRSVHEGRMLCTACLKVLPTIGELIQHCKLHHQSGNGNLRCPDCMHYYKDLTTFLRHLETLKIETKDSKTPDREGSVLKLPPDNTAGPNRNTIPQNTHVKPKKCEICQAEFIKKNMLFGHLLGHKLNTLIKCKRCGQCFGRKRINFHVMTCRNDPPPPPKVPPVVVTVKNHSFQCSTCSRTFGKKYHLNRHLNGHAANSLVLCNACGQYFGKSKVDAHINTCSQKPEEPVAPAAIAAAVAPAAKATPPPKYTYPCTICPRMLGKKDRLLAHLIGHEKNTLTCCPFGCGQYFLHRKLPVHQNRCVMSLKPKPPQVKPKPKPPQVKSKPPVVPNIQETPSQSVTKKPVFKCLHCNQEFKFKSEFLRHSVKHSGLQPYPCSRCGQRFRSRSLAKQHMEICHKVEPADDDGTKESCDPSPSQVESAKEADLRYKCTFCNKCFLKARSLRNHILTHNEAKPYRCKSCQSSFSRFDHLKVHQASCKVKKMRLEICIPKLSLEDVAQGWKSSMESQETPQCKFCFKSFPALSSLNRHITLFHTVKHFKCKQCSSTFSHEKSLKFHMKKMCKSILKKRSLGNHSLNTAEKPLDKLRNVTLKRPLTDFKSMADHTCTYCSLSFANASSLKNHMQFHSSVWPFSCQHCGERFPRKDYVQRHHLKCARFLEKSKEPHGSSQDKPGEGHAMEEKCDQGFSCAYCSSRFSLFSQLQEHFLNVHQLETTDQPVRTASLQHHLSNMSGLDKSSDQEQLNEKLGSTSNLTCELDTILTVEAPRPFQCTTCGKALQNISAYQAHLRVHTVPYFHCPVCRKGFWNKLALRKHKRKCMPKDVPAGNRVNNSEAKVDQTAADSQLSLDISSKTTSPSVVLSTKGNPEKSRKSQKEEVRYQCSECHKSFTDGLLLITHLEDHRREELDKKRHTCSTCGKICDSQANLVKHMRVHYNSKKYSCPDCTKVLNTQSELDNHRAFHDPTRAYACKLCTYRFNSGPTLCAHYAEEHPNEMLKCRFCNRSYSAEVSLMRHYKKHHKNEVKNNVPPLANSQQMVADDGEDQTGEDSDSDTAPYFPCHVCGKTFTTSESLEDHQRCHLGEKPHECAECGKCFFLAGQLEHHQRMHRSEFQCQLCGKGFVSQFALRKHKNTHGKSRAHHCTKCQLTFTGASQLAAHMTSHREENFPCDICDRVFNSKSSRFEHRKTHTSETVPMSSPKKSESAALPLQYRCGDCNECFGESEALLEHGCKVAEERRHKCSACHKNFLQASHLIKHLSTEHPDVQCSTDSMTLDLKKEMDHSTDFICSVCNLSFTNGDELRKHFSTHSSEICIKKEQPSTSEAEIHCLVCNCSFLGSKAYEVHVCSKQKTQPSVKNAQVAFRTAREDEDVDVISGDLYNCTDCTMSFPSQSALLEHRTVLHENDKPYRCRLCQKTFAFRHYLKKHMKRHLAKQDSTKQTHEVENEFQCDQCGAVVASEQELSLHMSLHVEQGEGLYSCDLCLESFKHWSLFKRHQESHMGQVVYECTECDKAFAFPDLLEEHQQMHASHR
ncbi:zinc finger protein 1035 [Synchiropus picturatus]